MPNYTRPKIKGASVFFTVCIAQRSSDLLVREVDHLRNAVDVTRREQPFYIDAWVVLPDHLHCVWTLPENDADFSTRWGAIKGRFSSAVRRAGFTPPVARFGINGGVNPALRKGQVGIWQKRFWEHHIRDERDMEAHIRYCLNNPVKHGLVERASDWPFSSIHRDIRMGRIEPEWSETGPEGMYGE